MVVMNGNSDENVGTLVEKHSMNLRRQELSTFLHRYYESSK